ncbi:MAG: lamin tail domain-containing protein [Bacteroidia bacterium]
MKKLLLIFGMFAGFTTAYSQCNELFISEYAEGSGNNKAIEFYNPTANAISMSNYRLVRYSNGSPTGTDSTDLVGTIQPYSTFIIANGQTSGTPTSPACDPALQAMAQQLDHAYPAPTYVNGDDAMVLARISPYAIIDIFGEIGVQPNTAWSDVAPYIGTTGKWWTKDHSLQRKPTVTQGVMTNPSPFIVTAEYDSLPKDNWTNLGIHACNCAPNSIKEINKTVEFKVYPNPSAASSKIAISANTNFSELVLFNITGQTVISRKLSTDDDHCLIDANGLSSGIYFVQLKSNKGNSKIQKLVIQ